MCDTLAKKIMKNKKKQESQEEILKFKVKKDCEKELGKERKN